MQGKRSSEVHRINCCINICVKRWMWLAKQVNFILYENPSVNLVIYNVYQYKKKKKIYARWSLLDWMLPHLMCNFSEPQQHPLLEVRMLQVLGQQQQQLQWWKDTTQWTVSSVAQTLPSHHRRRNGTDKTCKTNLKWKQSLCISVLFSQKIPAPSNHTFQVQSRLDVMYE